MGFPMKSMCGFSWIQRVFGTALQTHLQDRPLSGEKREGGLGGLGGAGVGWDPL